MYEKQIFSDGGFGEAELICKLMNVDETIVTVFKASHNKTEPITLEHDGVLWEICCTCEKEGIISVSIQQLNGDEKRYVIFSFENKLIDEGVEI